MDRRKALKQVAYIMGGALSVPIVNGILSGCTPSSAVAGKLVFFNEQEFASISAMADRILPATATPGALDVGVPGFIDLMLQDVYTEKLQAIVKEGLVELERQSQEQHAKDFSALSAEEQDGMLTTMEEKALVAESAPGEKPFFSIIKELTIGGFFTSEQGAKATLDVVPIPGKFEACIPLESKTAYI
ncbi:MAG: gluconate 2-dehydrogenase subunit 3 family protein [Bacteroidota bacterium]